MHPKKFAAKKSKVAGTTKVYPVERHLDSDYELVPCSDTLTETGWVVIAILKAQTGKRLPEFYLRWDERKAELDVDIWLDGMSRRDLWSQPGYEGHKTRLINPDEREYGVRIKIPGKLVFEGTVRVRLVFSESIEL